MLSADFLAVNEPARLVLFETERGLGVTISRRATPSGRSRSELGSDMEPEDQRSVSPAPGTSARMPRQLGGAHLLSDRSSNGRAPPRTGLSRHRSVPRSDTVMTSEAGSRQLASMCWASRSWDQLPGLTR
jgi:hypothetical protein